MLLQEQSSRLHRGGDGDTATGEPQETNNTEATLESVSLSFSFFFNKSRLADNEARMDRQAGGVGGAQGSRAAMRMESRYGTNNKKQQEDEGEMPSVSQCGGRGEA